MPRLKLIPIRQVSPTQFPTSPPNAILRAPDYSGLNTTQLKGGSPISIECARP